MLVVAVVDLLILVALLEQVVRAAVEMPVLLEEKILELQEQSIQVAVVGVALVMWALPTIPAQAALAS